MGLQSSLRQRFAVKENENFSLEDFPTAIELKYSDNEVAGLEKRLRELQELLYAGKKYGLLVVLQGLDTSGKDSTIRQVFRCAHPLGLRAVNFTFPTPLEQNHDFLWRIHQQIPRRSEIVIFNRSHYEDIVTAFIRQTIDRPIREQRTQHILDFEKLLFEENILVAKFFLHISKDEQKKRLQKRLDDPKKQWKFDPQDLKDRKNWDQFMSTYSDALGKTSREQTPWFVIPADKKDDRNWLVLNILVDMLEELKMNFPANPNDLSQFKID